MKKYKLIYNPMSGNKKFHMELDTILMKFHEADIDLHIFRTSSKDSISSHIKHIADNNYDAILISGGDGTVNQVINSMMMYSLNIPIGIIPSGTANDFARFIKMPTTIAECCDIFIAANTKKIDLGFVNGQYFLNVCGGGLLTNVSQNINIEYKNLLGKLAYYIKGVEQIPNFTPLPVLIETSTRTYTDELYFFIILNSGNVGGIEKVSPQSQIDDGLFEFIGVKSGSIVDLAVLLVKKLTGNLLDDDSILYFQDNKIKLELIRPLPQFEETDIDGESGPLMPIEVAVIPQAMTIFVP